MPETSLFALETRVAKLEARFDRCEQEWNFALRDIAHHVTITLGMITQQKIETDQLKAEFRRLEAEVKARMDAVEAKVDAMAHKIDLILALLTPDPR